MPRVVPNLSCFLIGLIIGVANAAATTTIPYQGKLTNTSGQPVNGAVNIHFSIWNAASAGRTLWAETLSGVVVSNGLFSVDLGASPTAPFPDSLFAAPDLYLEMRVEPDAQALAPRHRLGGFSAYARRAAQVDVRPRVLGHRQYTGLGVEFDSGVPRGATVAVDSLTVTLPTSGDLVLEAGGWTALSKSGTGVFHELLIGIVQTRNLGPGPVDGRQVQYLTSQLPSGSYWSNFLSRRVFENLPAGTYTFYLNASKSGDPAYSGSIEEFHITATHFPD